MLNLICFLFSPFIDLYEAFLASSVMGRTIVTAQFAIAAFLSGVMVTKHVELKKFLKASEDFRHFFTKCDYLLGHYFQRSQSENPMIKLYVSSSERLVRELTRSSGIEVRGLSDAEKITLSKKSLSLVRGFVEENLSTESIALEKNMTLIGLGATTAPLIGLLGTVWGVLEAFMEMGKLGAVNLGQIAPSLSSAMLTTVLGLFIAIPAAVFYNFLFRSIRRENCYLDGFADEFIARMNIEFGEE